MTPADAKDFILRLTALGELFDAKLSEAKQLLYYEALSDIDLTDLVNAMAHAARHCKFMPRPVELREFALGNIDDDALEAWNSYKKAARVGGAMRAVICEADTGAAIEATFGSWSEACLIELSPEMWASKQKEFIRNFKIFRRDHREDAGRVLLKGSSEHSRWNRTLLIDVDGAVIEADDEDMAEFADTKRLN